QPSACRSSRTASSTWAARRSITPEVMPMSTRKAIESTNPANLDAAALLSYAQKYGREAMIEAVRRREGLEGDSHSTETGGLEDLDDYFRCKIGAKSDIRDLFVPRFYFGCEADDPVNAWAFNKKANPMGAHVRERSAVLGPGEPGLLQGHRRREGGGPGAGAVGGSRRRRLDLADDVHQSAERRQARIEIVRRRLDAQRGHPGVAVLDQPLADHFLGAEQVSLQHELVRHAHRGFVTLAVEPESLYLDRRVGVAGALVGVIVEVVLPGAHGAEREGEPGLARRDQPRQIIPERDHSSGLQIQGAQRTPDPGGAGRDVIEEDARVLGHERGAEPAVGHLARHLET